MTTCDHHRQRSGIFITVEGSEGSGKTTSLDFISEWLSSRNIDFIMTREPGGTPMAENIRQMLLHPQHDEPIDNVTELLLVFAARAQHLRHVIRPAINERKVVVCDRFTDTTWAYQGGGRQVNKTWIGQLENMVQGTMRPDKTIFLDIPVEEGLKRAVQRSQPDRFEKEQIAFFERVRQAYQERAMLFKEQYYVIDSKQPIDKVNTALDDFLREFIVL